MEKWRSRRKSTREIFWSRRGNFFLSIHGNFWRRKIEWKSRWQQRKFRGSSRGRGFWIKISWHCRRPWLPSLIAFLCVGVYSPRSINVERNRWTLRSLTFLWSTFEPFHCSHLKSRRVLRFGNLVFNAMILRQKSTRFRQWKPRVWILTQSFFLQNKVLFIYFLVKLYWSHRPPQLRTEGKGGIVARLWRRTRASMIGS